jgi:ribosomal protein S18 acetylase RimI-like enzyme
MTLVIRNAVQEDYDAVNAIIREGQVEHAQALPSVFANVERVVAMGWYRSFSGQSSKCILVADLDGIPVGVAMLEVKHSPAYEALVPRRYVYLNELAVALAHRRKGIGKMLVQACLVWSKEREASGLELNVWEFNQEAISFYQSLGLNTLNRTMHMPL